MATNKKRRKRKGLIPKLILAVFVVYSAGVLISHQIEVNKYKNSERELDEAIKIETMRKAQLEEKNSAEIDEEYIIREAQSQGYAAPNERVFVDISGS